MQNRSWLSILFDFALLVVLAWATIHYMNKLDAAKEGLEVIRNGFSAILCMLTLVSTCMLQRMEQILRENNRQKLE